jgi:hypothetical protein
MRLRASQNASRCGNARAWRASTSKKVSFAHSPRST